MRDRPDPFALLSIVADTLHADVIPNLTGAAAYQARIAASLVAMVAREIRQGPGDDAAEIARLRALLGRGEGELADLNADFAARLRDGRLMMESPDVAAHLWATTHSKLAVDQPAFPRYRQLKAGA